MPKIFALRDRLMEVQQSLTNDENDVRGGKRNVGNDDDDFKDHFSGSSTSKSFGFEMFSNFDSIFEKKMNPWHFQTSSMDQEQILTIEGKIIKSTANQNKYS